MCTDPAHLIVRICCSVTIKSVHQAFIRLFQQFIATNLMIYIYLNVYIRGFRYFVYKISRTGIRYLKFNSKHIIGEETTYDFCSIKSV